MFSSGEKPPERLEDTEKSIDKNPIWLDERCYNGRNVAGQNLEHFKAVGRPSESLKVFGQ